MLLDRAMVLTVASFSTLRPGFISGPFYVRYVVNKVAPTQECLLILRFSYQYYSINAPYTFILLYELHHLTVLLKTSLKYISFNNVLNHCNKPITY